MKPKKPLPRSKTPIKRTPLKRGLGRRGKVKAEAMKAARQWFFELGHTNCQLCNYPFGEGDIIDPHHKILRSQGGQDTFENLIMLHRTCHNRAHESFEVLERIRNSPANIENGLFIYGGSNGEAQ